MPASKHTLGAVPVIRLSQSSALTMGFADAAASQSIGLIMYNAAQTQQAVQQIEIAILGFLLAEMAVAAGAGA